MTILFEDEAQIELPFDPKEISTLVIEEAVSFFDCPYETEVSVLLVDEETIRQMNLDHREIDRITDVLSFPMISYQEPAVWPEDEMSMQDAFHPESGELMLGDIVICVKRMQEQAEEYGHSQRREFAFLVAHSMLHLFGYDHMTEEEAGEMEALQKTILNNIHITREEG